MKNNYKTDNSIIVTLEVSHLDILGNEIKDLHDPNIRLIFLTFEVTQFDKSGNDIKDLQL